MKKIVLLISTFFLCLFLTACNNYQASTTEIIAKTPETITWKNYAKTYVTLAGIQFPSDFYLDDTNAIEIRSTEIPLLKNNECFFAPPCAENGLNIVIGLTKPMDENILEDTKYPHIKKINAEKAGIPPESIKNFNYREYLYLAKNNSLPYLIQIYEKNFKGDSAAIIDGILNSLHEL